MRIKTILMCSALALSFAVPASAEELSLENAVARGMITNPQYGVVANNRMATEEELAQGKGLFLPSVDLQGSAGIERTDNLATGNKENFRQFQYGITLTQMLFDGFAAKNEVERQEYRVKSAAHRVEETGQLVGLAVVEAYLEVMRQRDLLQIAKDNVKEHMSMMDEIKSGAQAGRSTEADVAQAESRVASARAEEAAVRQSLRVGESEFIKATGETPDVLVMPKVPTEQLQPNVDDAVKLAMTESPTLGIYEADANVAWQEYEATKANYYPKVNLQLQAGRGNDQGGVRDNEDSVSAGVIANWNIFRGMIDTHNSREAVYRHAQAKEERASQARVVEDDLRQTWASMVAAGERAKEFNEQADANAKVVTAYKDQFELDRRTLLDVLDSQNELFVARSNAVNAQYLEILAVYRVLALQGRLLPTLGVPSPREASLETHVK